MNIVENFLRENGIFCIIIGYLLCYFLLVVNNYLLKIRSSGSIKITYAVIILTWIGVYINLIILFVLLLDLIVSLLTNMFYKKDNNSVEETF